MLSDPEIDVKRGAMEILKKPCANLVQRKQKRVAGFDVPCG